MKEENSSLSKQENECNPNQHQTYSEEWEDSKENHDIQINKEFTSDFWVVDWGIG